MTATPIVIAFFIALAATGAAGPTAQAAPPGCTAGFVFEDRDGDGRRDRGEPGIAGVKVSDGTTLVTTGAAGRYALVPAPGRSLFVVKPAGYRVPHRADGLPAIWSAVAGLACPSFALKRSPGGDDGLDVLVFADPQPKSAHDVDYFERDIIEPLLADAPAGQPLADLGLSLGDIVDDDTGLYPGVISATTRLRTPWLHVPGNHDLDAGVAGDDGSLGAFHHHFGPDTLAWEEPEATFIALDDVIALPGQRPAYVGGLREDQFAFLERYLPTVDPSRLLVLAVHIPLAPEKGRDTFRPADRARLFAMLERFPKLLVLSGHSHAQRHHFHDASTGWTGAAPLHEYTVGAASGAFWSGVEDAAGIPDATMADGTPNGHARLRVAADGSYRLSWHPARLAADDPSFTQAMALHAPRVLRRGAYPAWAVYANVFMGHAGTRVEYRIDDGEWTPMARVERADPRLLAENVRDDEADALRGYDRSPEAQPSTHLWRGALPTSLAAGEHRIDVRAFDEWQGEQRASTSYRLEDASP